MILFWVYYLIYVLGIIFLLGEPIYVSPIAPSIPKLEPTDGRPNWMPNRLPHRKILFCLIYRLFIFGYYLLS